MLDEPWLGGGTAKGLNRAGYECRANGLQLLEVEQTAKLKPIAFQYVAVWRGRPDFLGRGEKVLVFCERQG